MNTDGTAQIETDANVVDSVENEWSPIQEGRSVCWNHFRKHTVEQKCKCVHCNKILSTPGFVTSTLRRHMSTCKRNSSNIPASSSFQESTKVLVGKLVSMGLSFSVIAKIREECPEITRLPKTQQDIRAAFDEAANDIIVLKKKKISELLQQGKRFGVTLDESTRMGNRKFLNINVHTANVFINIGMIRMSGSSNAETMNDRLHQRLSSYGVDLKRHVVGFTSDAASTNLKLGRLNPQLLHNQCLLHATHLAHNEFKETIDTVDSTVQIPPSETLLCCETVEQHEETLRNEDNLSELLLDNEEIADLNFFETETDDTEDVPSTSAIDPDIAIRAWLNSSSIEQESRSSLTDEAGRSTSNEQAGRSNSIFNFGKVIKKVKKVGVTLKKSSRANNLFRQKCQDMGKKFLVNTIPCKTRWNSWPKCMRRYRYNHEVIKRVLPNLAIDNNEHGMVERYIDGVEPLVKFVPYLSDRKTTLFQSEIGLMKIFNDLKNINNGFSNILSDRLEQKILKRRNTLLMQLAWSLWDPAFFTKTIDFYNKRINQDLIMSTAVDLIQRLTENVEQDLSTNPVQQTLLTSVLDGSFQEIGSKLETNSRHLARNMTSTLAETLNMEYLNFQSTGIRSTNLEKLKNYLDSIPPTSIESERSFSDLGFMLTDKRNSLKDTTVDKIIIVRDFYRK